MKWFAIIGPLIFLGVLGVGAVLLMHSLPLGNTNESSPFGIWSNLPDIRDEDYDTTTAAGFFSDADGEMDNAGQSTADSLVMVVPHHDLVKDRRSRLFEERSNATQPDTIILLSPNHFSAGRDDVITTDRVWSVENGEASVVPATDVIDVLVSAELATVDDTVFDTEHGIKNILSDIHAFFPDATLVPLVLKESIDPAAVELLVEALAATCDSCGVIASVDFSHYQPAALADVHDIKSIRALVEMDVEDVWEAEVDSQASLAFAMQWAGVQRLERFVLADHTNSGVLEGNPEAETTTHVFGYYDDGASTVGENNGVNCEQRTVGDSSTARVVAGCLDTLNNTLTFTFAGDGMFGRFVGAQFQDGGFRDLFSSLGDRTLWGTDISWMNLEGPVSDAVVAQSTDPDDTRFLFSRQTVDALRYLHLTTAGLGNNHTLDAGETGYATTQAVLTDVGIDVHGHSRIVVAADVNMTSPTSVVRYEQGDVHLSLIAVNALADVSGLEELIRSESDAGQFVVVLPHWGVEYATTHSPKQEEFARAWVAAGTDLIIGSHPHVVQDAQVIDGVLVLYSLGNFVFDQTFSDETQRGLLITGELHRDSLRVVLVPVVSHALRPEFARGEVRQTIVDRVCANIQEVCVDGQIVIALD